MMGNYSQIDSTYIKNAFGAKDTLQSMVHSKKEALQNFLADLLDIEVTDNMELWSKPLKENEMIAYESSPKYCVENTRSVFGFS